MLVSGKLTMQHKLKKTLSRPTYQACGFTALIGLTITALVGQTTSQLKQVMQSSGYAMETLPLSSSA